MRGAVTYSQSNEDSLYRKIRGAMALYGVTQADIADELGLRQNSVSYLMKNKALSARQLCQIADMFKFEVTLCDRQ